MLDTDRHHGIAARRKGMTPAPLQDEAEVGRRATLVALDVEQRVALHVQVRRVDGDAHHVPPVVVQQPVRQRLLGQRGGVERVLGIQAGAEEVLLRLDRAERHAERARPGLLQLLHARRVDVGRHLDQQHDRHGVVARPARAGQEPRVRVVVVHVHEAVALGLTRGLVCDVGDGPVGARLVGAELRVHARLDGDQVVGLYQLRVQDVAELVGVLVVLGLPAGLEALDAKVVVVADRALHAGFRALDPLNAGVARRRLAAAGLVVVVFGDLDVRLLGRDGRCG